MTRLPAKRTRAPPSRKPRIGLALGGGGARGLAHILMLEAFDELDIKPAVIAGTSIGAIFGAAYASGLSAKIIRAHTERVLSKRLHLVRELYAARAPRSRSLWNLFSSRNAVLDAAALLAVLMPDRLPLDFSELVIPFRAVATDFYALEAMIVSSGPLLPAIAASMALPVLFEPVTIGGRALVDGGLVNPLPFDVLKAESDVIVAIDVSGAPVAQDGRSLPRPLEALFASAFIFERTIIKEKLKTEQPDLYIDAGMSGYHTLDFLKARQIMAAAQPAKERLKEGLVRILKAEIPPPPEAPKMAIEKHSSPERPDRPRRRLPSRDETS